jgi:hypothetical protein
VANPFTAGTERNKLFAFASAKGTSDKGSVLFAETHVGKGVYDVTGGTAVLKTLSKSSAVAHSSASR